MMPTDNCDSSVDLSIIVVVVIVDVDTVACSISRLSISSSPRVTFAADSPLQQLVFSPSFDRKVYSAVIVTHKINTC